jgi:hypothetical protein
MAGTFASGKQTNVVRGLRPERVALRAAGSQESMKSEAGMPFDQLLQVISDSYLLAAVF